MEILKQVLHGRSEEVLSYSYLFHGPKGSNKRQTADFIAKKLLNTEYLSTHPDYISIDRPQSKPFIQIETIRELNRQLRLSSMRGGHTVAILKDAQALNKASSNSLLKILEEPPDYVTIILIADSPFSLPETIYSRCEVYKFYNHEKLEVDKISDTIIQLLNTTITKQFSTAHNLIIKIKKQPDVKSFQIGESVLELAKDIELVLQHVMHTKISGNENNYKMQAKSIEVLTKQYSVKKISSMLLSLGDLRYNISMKCNPQLALEKFLLQVHI